MSHLTKFISRFDLTNTRIDRDNNVIKGVSLVSLGEARGHKKFADQTTLEQVRDCAKKYKSGLRVRFNPTTFNHGDAGLAGYIPSDTIEIKDGKVIGDLHVFSNFNGKDYLYEMAERAPDTFGLSIEFNGIPEKIGDENFARCEEIFAATVVDLPAANPTGLFAAKDLTNDKSNEKENDNMELTKENLADIGKAAGAAAVEALKPILTTFRATNGNGDNGGDPTEEEMAAAGCTDDMTDDQKKQAVVEWRAKDSDKPVTKKDLLTFFRFTGGKPARASGEVTKDDKNKAGGNEGFEALVTKYRQTGMSDAKATLRAREDNPKAYNEWCQKGRPEIKDQTNGK